MSYFSLLYQQVGPIDSLKVVSADAVLHVSNSGNDTSGTGSTAAPFQTLTKALNFAREHLILGNATLTIRLQPGEYTLTENVDLYHPQGSNLIIEGDPSAFTQHVIWRVQDYTWSLANFAGGGHTGTISLFNGFTTSGSTFHGFTTADNGKYFSVVNAAIGSRSGYSTTNGGISAPSSLTTVRSSYDPLFWGDRFFNHGYSFEEGNGILGIGRILNANTNPHTVGVQFSNLNYDGRCPAWNLNGGINSATPLWAGLSNNYPESQYSQPNGYYGSNGWRVESGGETYPARPGGSIHITPDPMIMSTYPVVIRANYGSNSGTLYLKNGSLRGLRNIMFASSNTPYTLQSGITGATLNYSQSISAFSDNGLPHDVNGTALYFENSTVGIRHIGFNGVGTAVSCNGSKVIKYTERTSETMDEIIPTDAVVGGVARRATHGNLDNAPVICTANCVNGIVAKNSTVDFTDSSGSSREYLTDYRDASVHISALSKPISLFGSQFKATSVVANSHSMIPSFKMDIFTPVFRGGTGDTFLSRAGSTAFWSSYPIAKAFVNVAGSGRQEIGLVNFVEDSGLTASNVAGTTIGASYQTVICSNPPIDYKRYTLHGLKTIQGISFMNADDIKNGITTAFGSPAQGGTLEVEFYSDIAGTVCASYYGLGRYSVLLRGSSGPTFGILGTTTSSMHNYLQSYDSYGVDGTYLGNYFQNRKTTIQAFDGSDVMIEKALVIDNGGAVPVEIAKNSSLIVGDSIVSANKVLGIQNNGQTDGTFGAFNYSSGAVCITGYAYSGIHCWDNSCVVVGSLFIKHPTAVNCFQSDDQSSSGRIIKIEQSSQAILGNIYALLTVGTSFVLGRETSQTATTNGSGYWKSRLGTGYGFVSLDRSRANGFILVDKNSSAVLELATGAKVFHFDGGAPNCSGIGNPRNASLMTARNSSTILVGDVQQSLNPYVNSNLSTRFTVDTRAETVARIATRSNGTNGSSVTVYNTTGARTWAGATSATISVHDVNIGNYSDVLTNSNGQKDIVPAAGITYCTSYSGFSRILGI